MLDYINRHSGLNITILGKPFTDFNDALQAEANFPHFISLRRSVLSHWFLIYLLVLGSNELPVAKMDFANLQL